jgi:putative transposase
VERSHEAIRQWVQRRLAPICDRFDVDRRSVRTIFVDETMVRIRGRQAWVWVAYEPRLKAFLSFRVSYNQFILDAYLFLKELRGRYGRKKPVWTDEGVWYPEACRWLRLEHHVYPTEWKKKKNLIEREDEPGPEGQAGELRRPLPLLQGRLRQRTCQQLDQRLQVLL